MLVECHRTTTVSEIALILFLFFIQEIPEDNTDTLEELVVTQRNKIMDEIVEKTKEKKTKSLLEIHQQKLKKKKKVIFALFLYSSYHKCLTTSIRLKK